MTAAAAFYAEWAQRASKGARSIERARILAEALGATELGLPVLTVVGSKGKGTAATYASAYLVAAGCRVVTVTSPGLRQDTDRIRIDGAALQESELAALGDRIRRAARKLPARHHDDGYLSPSGLFTVAGALYARDSNADVAVLEAGMGGISDEVSLFVPNVLAITKIFAEHIGVLGHTPSGIAVDKAGIARPDTSAVVSLPQSLAVAEAISTTVNIHTRGWTTPEVVEVDGGIPRRLLPRGLGRNNARLGCVAAQRLLQAMTRTNPDGTRLSEVLGTVRLPGRGSHHALSGTDTHVFVDSAINRIGAAAALTEARLRWGHIDHVIVCLPDHKDVTGVIAELEDLPVTYIRLTDYPELHFTDPVPGDWKVEDSDRLDSDWLARKGKRIVALGTVYFTGKILDIVEADTTHLFDPCR